MFSRCSDGELGELATLFSEMPAAASGQDVVLFEIGQPADAVFLLAAGSATLESPDDEVCSLFPPALLGELGALTGVPRSTKVTVRDAVCFRADALRWQQFLFEHHGFGLRVLRDMLRVAAEKVHRDQIRLGTLRQTSQWTQDGLREVAALVKRHPDTPISARVLDSVDSLIMRNRRNNLRVTPSATMPATLHLDGGVCSVIELSRTHLSFSCQTASGGFAVGSAVSGVLSLAGRTLPLAGKVIRRVDERITLEIEELSRQDAAPLEGYLTRAQLLDILL